MCYKSLIRPLLFSLDPEKVHRAVLAFVRCAEFKPVQKIISTLYDSDDRSLGVDVFGLHFRNRIGLAAGFDKNCEAFSFFSCLGFGHVELGTVTSQAQPGNPKPRIFRFTEDKALINRLGFPSDGVDKVVPRLQRAYTMSPRPVIGVNIGRSRSVTLEAAQEDYLTTFLKVSAYADYITLNVSSPNTPELRKLQEKSRLIELFKCIQANNAQKKPLLVKISPDLSVMELNDILYCCNECNLQGVIATNTTLARDGLSRPSDEVGGLSGAPLHQRACQMVRYISQATGGKLPVIGCGGIFTAQDALDMLQAGASLVQVYTSLVYEGPGLCRRINRELAQLIK